MNHSSAGSAVVSRMAQAMLAAILLLWACAAQAVTLDFEDHLAGADPGVGPVATLAASDVAGGVAITLTNTGALDAWIGRLALSYGGQAGDLRLLAGSPGDRLRLRQMGAWPDRSEAGIPGVISIRFRRAEGPLAPIRPGQSLSFTILGATTGDLFGGPRAAVLDMITGPGDLSRYGVARIAVVPLPAAGLMLLGALGLIAVLRRPRRGLA